MVRKRWTPFKYGHFWHLYSFSRVYPSSFGTSLHFFGCFFLLEKSAETFPSGFFKVGGKDL